MTLVLDLTVEQEERLRERAQSFGVEPTQYLLRLLDNDAGQASGLRAGESLLDGLRRIGALGAFKSTPRQDGRPWSEIEGYEFE